MKQLTNGFVSFDENKLYCYHLNEKVQPNGEWPCRGRWVSWEKEHNHSCSNCSLAAGIIIAEKQRNVDEGYAVWMTTEKGERIAVQRTKYGWENRKYR